MLKRIVRGLFCVLLSVPPLLAREAEEESQEHVQRETVGREVPIIIDWENPQETLKIVLEKLVNVAGYFEGVEVVYFKNYRFVDADNMKGSNDNGAIAIAYSSKNPLNKRGHSLIAVGYAIFEIAKTTDELAWFLGHEVVHLAAGHEERRRQYWNAEFERWAQSKDRSFVLVLNLKQMNALFRADRRAQLENFKRQLETEADQEALNLIAVAGFNPNNVDVSAQKHMEDLAQALDITALDESTGQILNQRKSPQANPRDLPKKDK